jgi:hypothetical protein
MSVEHCGKPRDTAYCPDCGAKLEEFFSGIQGLKRHVQARVGHLTASLGAIPDDKDCDRAAKNLAKWQSWRDDLMRLIDASG